MELSFSLGIARCVPAREVFSEAGSSTWLVHKNSKKKNLKELGQYLAIFTSHLVNNAPIKFVLAGGVLFRPSRRDWEIETLVSAGNKVFRFGGKPGGVVNQ